MYCAHSTTQSEVREDSSVFMLRFYFVLVIPDVFPFLMYNSSWIVYKFGLLTAATLRDIKSHWIVQKFTVGPV